MKDFMRSCAYLLGDVLGIMFCLTCMFCVHEIFRPSGRLPDFPTVYTQFPSNPL